MRRGRGGEIKMSITRFFMKQNESHYSFFLLLRSYLFSVYLSAYLIRNILLAAFFGRASE